MTILVKVKGGAGSGNYGHAGRPGIVGGSAKRSKPGAAVTKPELRPLSGEGDAEEMGNDYFNAVVDDYGTPMGENWRAASDDERAAVKADIVTDLSERTGIPMAQVDAVIKQWAYTGNDSDMRALSLQEAASEELGIPLSDWQSEKIAELSRPPDTSWIARQYPHLTEEQVAAEAAKIVAAHERKAQTLLPRDQERALIRAMYDRTQEEFSKMGYGPDDSITLYRGVKYDFDMGWSEWDRPPYEGNAMESWSISEGIANQFAGGKGGDMQLDFDEHGYVLAADIPVRNIISTARTGFGCLTEGEIVAVGSMPKSTALVFSAFTAGEEEGADWEDYYEEGEWEYNDNPIIPITLTHKPRPLVAKPA